MNRKRLQQVVLGSAGAVVLAGGALLAAAEYQSGNQFAPTESDRALNINQVVFPEQEKPTQGADQDSKDNSELWEKDQNADDTDRPQENSTADYLFESSQTMSGSGPQNATLNGSTTTAGSGEGGADIIYDITGDASRADVVLDSGASAGTDVDNAGDNANADAASNGQNGSNAANSNTSTTPSDTTDDTGTTEPDEPHPPEIVIPADKADDPVISDDNKNTIFGDPAYRYDESLRDLYPDADLTPIIGQAFSSDGSIYIGQKLTGKDIFNYLDAYFMIGDPFNPFDYKIYNWRSEDYGKYIRVTAVSFDGGVTWINEFPVTVPENIPGKYMRIRVEYRLSTTDDWTSEDVPYSVSDSRVLVLNTRTSGNNITNDQILNSITQYPAEGYQMALLDFQQAYLGKEKLTELFPGWTENGELVPWYYTVTPGRHILLPAEKVPLDTSLYQVEIIRYFSDSDLNIYLNASDYPFSDNAYLQTLTAYRGKTTLNEDYVDHIDTLTVPEYVQAVQFLYSSALNVGTLELPASVLYVDATGVKSFMDDPVAYDRGLQVETAYKVAADNPNYTAIDGLLYNKEETAIEGVPTGRTELVVPASVTSVTIPYQSKLKQLTFEGTTLEELPEVNYAQLRRSCLISMPEELLDDYIVAQSAQLQTNRLHVSATEDPAHRYMVQDDMAITDSGVVHLFLGSGAHWLSLTNDVTGLEADSLRTVLGLQTLMLPQNGEVVTFEAGCFNGADTLQTIGCYSQEQYDAAKAAAPEGVEVILMGERQNGYTFMRKDDEVLLLGVPDGLTTFDGTIPMEDGTTLAVTTIGDGVFKDYADLVWVDLSKSTTAIGYQAFQNCYNLQGVVINAPESITISEKAFDGCNSLRFIASNAAYGDVEDWDLALSSTEAETGFLYCPTGAAGYNSNWLYFSEDSDIARYELLECGGTRVLYGVDAENRPTLALRAGKTADGAVTLPDSTNIIYKAAFQNTKAASGGSFTVNFEDLYGLFLLDNYAFYQSDVGPDVTLPYNPYVENFTFAVCNSLTSVTIPGDSIVLEKSVFASCTNLVSATIGGTRNDISGVYDGIFNGCANLRELTFTSNMPPRLLLYNAGIDYMFNREDWETPETEMQMLHITVPEGSELYYVDSWRYSLLGYASYGDVSAYQDMYVDVRADLFWKYYPMEPTDAEVRAEMDSRLLASENRARAMLGLPLVDAIEHDYDYVISDDGMITLTGARGITATDLSSETLEMPDGYYLDYIGSFAFMESPDLRMVELPFGLAGIYYNAFNGVKFKSNDPSDGLIMVYDSWSETVPQLILEYEGEPFSFGIDDSRIALMDLYGEGSRDAEFIQEWTLPMTGYSSVANLRAAVRNKLSENGAEPTDEEVEAEVTQRLMKGENRVRKMLFSSSEITDPSQMTFVDWESIWGSWSDADTYNIATPETAALPAETDDDTITEDPTETPAEEVPAEEEPDADTEETTDADAPPDDIATPETAQAG